MKLLTRKSWVMLIGGAAGAFVLSVAGGAWSADDSPSPSPSGSRAITPPPPGTQQAAPPSGSFDEALPSDQGQPQGQPQGQTQAQPQGQNQAQPSDSSD